MNTPKQLAILVALLCACAALATGRAVVPYSVESGGESRTVVTGGTSRILAPHLWGLSEVRAKDFGFCGQAVGENYETTRRQSGGRDRLATIVDPEALTLGGRSLA